MNKKIFFILLPVLALLFSFSGKDVHSISSGQGPEFSITVTSLQSHVPSVNMTRDDTHQKKNKIRIKARDDYSAIDVAEVCTLPYRIYRYCRSAFITASADFPSIYLSSYHLRGPPALNS
jgi:hypothetical protein